ncbi:hypothetical protein, partial [Burkholderia sp.]
RFHAFRPQTMYSTGIGPNRWVNRLDVLGQGGHIAKILYGCTVSYIKNLLRETSLFDYDGRR